MNNFRNVLVRVSIYIVFPLIAWIAMFASAQALYESRYIAALVAFLTENAVMSILAGISIIGLCVYAVYYHREAVLAVGRMLKSKLVEHEG